MKQIKMMVVAILLLTATNSATAQSNFSGHDYNRAVGVKFYPGAFSYKQFINQNGAIEGLAYFWNRGFRATGLYEFHFDIAEAAGLKWYVGPGAHVGFYRGRKDLYDGFTSIGIDGVLGLDYKFDGAPINMSIDWQPSIEFGNRYNNGFSGNWGGLAIRYVF